MTNSESDSELVINYMRVNYGIYKKTFGRNTAKGRKNV